MTMRVYRTQVSWTEISWKKKSWRLCSLSYHRTNSNPSDISLKIWCCLVPSEVLAVGMSALEPMKLLPFTWGCNNMHTISSVFWFAESMLIYPKQCKNVKLRVRRLDIKNKELTTGMKSAFWNACGKPLVFSLTTHNFLMLISGRNFLLPDFHGIWCRQLTVNMADHVLNCKSV